MFGGRKPSRLGQWDGWRRSHGEVSVLARLARRDVLARLAVVLLTVVAATALIERAGPPMPWRVGAVPDFDLRVRAYFEIINQPQTDQLREEEQERRPGEPLPVAPPVIEKYPPGMPLVRRGQPITESQHALLREEHHAFVHSLSTADRARRGGALFLVHLLLAALTVLYAVSFQPGLARSLPKTASVCGLALLTVGLVLLLSRPPWHAALLPLTVTALVLTVAYNPPFALLMSFSLALITTLAQGEDLSRLLAQTGGPATAVLLLRRLRTRTRLVETAAGAGLACVAMTLAAGLLDGQTTKFIAADAGRHFLWCLGAGFLVSGSLPLVERCFGVVTDVSLLELADSSHPLLQELIRRAPGTYTHSMTVATLAEHATEAIGGNALLVRVGSYFHDIGKMLKPHYFIENQAGENRHDLLEPALSTLVILGHVKDGVALGRQYNLPGPLIDFIQQHHGSTLVEYFYREALRLQEENGHGGAHELEFLFRYPGPKPQTREAGVLMLADAVESSSRALANPTPSSLAKLVHDLLMKRLLDGQFDDSGLTLTELHRVEQSLGKSLIALYHARIKYPEEAARPQAS